MYILLLGNGQYHWPMAQKITISSLITSFPTNIGNRSAIPLSIWDLKAVITYHQGIYSYSIYRCKMLLSLTTGYGI